jgi:hypothetical protein
MAVSASGGSHGRASIGTSHPNFVAGRSHDLEIGNSYSDRATGPIGSYTSRTSCLPMIPSKSAHRLCLIFCGGCASRYVHVRTSESVEVCLCGIFGKRTHARTRRGRAGRRRRPAAAAAAAGGGARTHASIIPPHLVCLNDDDLQVASVLSGW